MRAFIGVEVPPPNHAPSDHAATAPDHLTLRFLGEVDERTAEALMLGLRPALASVAPFSFVLEGVGAFPSSNRPRVVWRGVSRGKEEVGTLAGVVRATVASVVGPADSAPFVPHVTLFRVRSARDRERAERWLAPDAEIPPPTEVAVTEVHFVESQLGPTGPHHRTLARFPLLGPGA